MPSEARSKRGDLALCQIPFPILLLNNKVFGLPFGSFLPKWQDMTSECWGINRFLGTQVPAADTSAHPIRASPLPCVNMGP